MPPEEKKKKGSAAPKKQEAAATLTEEERLVLAQAEALKAEEARIAENEARLRDLRRRRVEESARVARNEKRVAARWLVIMREAKTEALREAAVVMARTHASRMDRKRALVRSLELELDDAETQQRRAAASHVTRVDALLTLHERGARKTSDAFATETRAIADAFSAEEAAIEARHARHRRAMLDVLDAMEKAHASSFAIRRARFETAREALRSRDAEAFENAKARLEASVRACARMCEDAHEAYVTDTDARAASFEQRTARDSRSARWIDSRARELGRLAKRARAARGKLERQSGEWRAKNEALREEKARVRDRALALAATTKRFRAEAESKLKALLRDSNGALKALDAKLIDAERVLRLAAAARRLETERERVVPFGDEAEEAGLETEGLRVGGGGADSDRSDSATVRDASEDDARSAGAADALGGAADETRVLERFFRRHNRAYLDALAARRELERLRAENTDLRETVAARELCDARGDRGSGRARERSAEAAPPTEGLVDAG